MSIRSQWRGQLVVSPDDLRSGFWLNAVTGPTGAIDIDITSLSIPTNPPPWIVGIGILVEGTAGKLVSPTVITQQITPVVPQRMRRTPRPKPPKEYRPDPYYNAPVHCSLAVAEAPWKWSWANGYKPFSDMSLTVTGLGLTRREKRRLAELQDQELTHK